MPILSQQTLRRLRALATLALLSATFALAQQTAPAGGASFGNTASDTPNFVTWEAFQQADRYNLDTAYVITKADPSHAHVCHVKSFDPDKLVCSWLNISHTYRASEVAAVILRGNHMSPATYKAWYLTVEAVAITGAAVLASISTAGAVVAAVAAGYLLLGMPYSFATTEARSSDTLLYLASGQTLRVRLRAAE